MRKLPQIYQCAPETIKTNNKNKCIVENVFVEEECSNTQTIIDEVFSELGYPFNILLTITTKEFEKTTSLIAKTKENIFTIDNEIIPISEILSIKRKKN